MGSWQTRCGINEFMDEAESYFSFNPEMTLYQNIKIWQKARGRMHIHRVVYERIPRRDQEQSRTHLLNALKIGVGIISTTFNIQGMSEEYRANLRFSQKYQ
jgi:hypothetical protein